MPECCPVPVALGSSSVVLLRHRVVAHGGKAQTESAATCRSFLIRHSVVPQEVRTDRVV
jgi:hypothetical protein